MVSLGTSEDLLKPTHQSTPSHFTHIPTHPHTSHTHPHILMLHTLTPHTSHITHSPSSYPHILTLYTPTLTSSHFTHTHSHDAPYELIWSFVGVLLLPRFVVMVMAVFLFRAKDNLRLTLAAKIHLCAALILSLLEEIPNSVFTLALPWSNCCGQCP